VVQVQVDVVLWSNQGNSDKALDFRIQRVISSASSSGGRWFDCR
jgi:hypothetical protein